MLLTHPEHATACSRRTEGMPLIFLDANGIKVYETETRKRACRLEIPDTAVRAVILYTSNSGRREVHAFAFGSDGTLLPMNWAEGERIPSPLIQDWLEPIES